MVLLAVAACDRKDDPEAGLTVTGTLGESATRVTIEDGEDKISSHWQSGDVIYGFWKDQNGTVKTLSYTVSGISGSGVATFSLAGGQEPSADGTAVHMVYASGNCCSGFGSDGKATVDLSAQEGTFEGLADEIIFCSTANVSGKALDFKFQSSTAVVNIKQVDGIASEETIKSIQFTASGIGSAEVSLVDGALAVTPSPKLSCVKADFKGGIGASTPIWLMTVPVENAGLRISVNTGKDVYTKGITKTLGAGRCIVVSKLSVSGGDVLNGEFTVDSDGNKVRFSRGNLQATRAGGILTGFGFAAHQYDFLASAQSTMDVTKDGTFDLFGWSTDVSCWGLQIHDNDDYSGDFVDWGTATGAGYRTLSAEETEYLMDANGFFMGQVNGISGLFLLPDSFSVPGGISISGMNSLTGDDMSNFTTGQFAALEAAGAVFLPAAGYRMGTDIASGSPGEEGKYWTSSSYDSFGDEAESLSFPDTGNGIIQESRAAGNSVRLVMDVG